jgi:pimeloyl-ACP methyl ester carboxylesterase
MAHHLERAGIRPAAVILLDTFRNGAALTDLAGDMLQGVLAREEWLGPFSSSRLSAMGRYVELLDEWATGAEPAAPILFVQAQEALAVTGGDGGTTALRATWDGPHTVREAPGDHFSMMEDHAQVTAQTVAQWLESLPGHRA